MGRLAFRLFFCAAFTRYACGVCRARRPTRGTEGVEGRGARLPRSGSSLA